MEQVRCKKCDKLLFYADKDLKGAVEIKCNRCKHTQKIKN